MFDVPIAGDATVELSTSGDIVSSDLALELGEGRIRASGPGPAVRDHRRSLPAHLRRHQAALGPAAQPGQMGRRQHDVHRLDDGYRDRRRLPIWRFDVDGKNGVLEAAEFKVPPVALDTWTAIGSLVPRRGVVDVSEFRLSGGGGEARAKATIQAGPEGQSTTAEVTLSPMPLDTLKALWPRALAPGAREWVGESVSAVTFKGGTIHYRNGDYLERAAPGGQRRRRSWCRRRSRSAMRASCRCRTCRRSSRRAGWSRSRTTRSR